MAAFLDNCRFIPTAGGTTDWIFSSAVGGCQSPALAGAVDTRKYKFIAISSDLTQWEISEGAYTASSGTFARTAVLYNSSGTGTATGQSGAGSKINFAAAPNVAIIGIKEDLISIEEANSFTTGQKTQARANIAAAASGANSDITSISGLTAPLSAAQGGTGNAGGAWSVSSPAPFPSASGAYASASSTVAYVQEGKKVFCRGQITVTSVGTAVGALCLNLPFTLASRITFGGKEAAVNGLMFSADVLSSGLMTLLKYDNTWSGYIANGTVFPFNFVAEAA